HELGQGIEAPRMLAEPLYARDVLLVCDALAVTDGPLLARAFRRAAAAPEEGRSTAPRPGTRARWTAWLGLAPAPQAAHAFSSRSSSAPSAT
ncbi:MAG: hypothetical protein RLZZ451_2444, partial [Pseudomonadota bacterium]